MNNTQKKKKKEEKGCIADEWFLRNISIVDGNIVISILSDLKRVADEWFLRNISIVNGNIVISILSDLKRGGKVDQGLIPEKPSI